MDNFYLWSSKTTELNAFSWVPDGILRVSNTILYENKFQNPQIFQQTISLFPEQSTLGRTFCIIPRRWPICILKDSHKIEPLRKSKSNQKQVCSLKMPAAVIIFFNFLYSAFSILPSLLYY
jgi:hypothetical protein